MNNDHLIIPRVLVVTAGLASKRSPMALALLDLYEAQVIPGKALAENKFDKILSKLCLAERFGNHAKNIKILNQCIKDLAGSFDVLFIVKGNQVTSNTLEFLKSLRKPPKIIGWSPDDVFLSHNSSGTLKAAASFYDVYFTAKSLNIERGELASMGFKDPRFIHQGFDRDWHRPLVNRGSIFSSLVTFVGYAEEFRFQKLNFLAKNGIKVHVWGNGWNSKFRSRADSNLVIHGYALGGDQYTEALTNSAINLCFLRKMNRDRHTSRTFEIPACGGFMLAERTDEHLKYFSENFEAAYFSNQEELLEKVCYYLEYSKVRAKIAHAGRQRCLIEDYSYHRLAREIIQATIINQNER